MAEKKNTKEEHAAKADKSSDGGNKLTGILGSKLFKPALLILILIAAAAAFLYYQDLQSKIYIEDATISAPTISLAPLSAGQIQDIYVSEGDLVWKGENLAKIGGQYIVAQSPGVITYVNNAPGQIASPSAAVIQMVDLRELRVVGLLAEDKGLSSIHAGQKVTFTADAFGGKQYQGVVESVGSTSVLKDIVFSISNRRQESLFEVKVAFDTEAYSELKNGMSAKMYVYK